ncbi:MAG TPA: DNA polymerase III subunit alpha [Bacteroidales bacterium]|nr:DNA polymerase III subunit alpha [Bacteroidales bacterium]
MVDFVHLHVHSQFSILDGACKLPDLIEKAIADGMQGVAVTDHGNMFGIKEFHDEACKHEGFKPIIGCETYVARRSRLKRSELIDRKGDHLILLAKNFKGYQNLSRLISLSWIEGHYYKPRVDKELLKLYSEGLIASSACLAGEIPRAILAGTPDKALHAINEYKEIFGEDFYLELMRHQATDPTRDSDVFKRQSIVNEALLELSRKTGVKLIATNDAHFLNEQDADAHDRLLCLNTGKDLDDPTRLRYSGQEWFKTRVEMQELFRDVPEALENTMEVFGKIECYQLNREPIMPDFSIPEGYVDADEYLRHLTYEGAKTRYPEITPEITERIEYELQTIKEMGFPGYFLIVQDFLKAARDMDVSVGPGRGSAAGSVVAYCTRITDIDPLKYDLLFERFLSPERVSMPDIDIDFDEDGRDKVVKWVVEKYGKDKVAQVITFGTMAAKMAIRDISRVQKLPLAEANMLAKLVPDKPKITLKQAYKEVQELDEARRSNNPLVAETLKFAEILEGSIRHTGLHACGIIIGKYNLIDHIPVTTSKDSSTLLVTQYDGEHIEQVGMLKMDFLGLKTLAIIKDAIKNIQRSKLIEVDLETIPFDDPLTYQLFSQGKTTGIFQFESDGMKKYLKELKPNRIEDLIAMNALYRPGPMEYIPKFINRKHGREKIEYDVPAMEKYLKDTYGITVYQEQVMLLSMELAGFTRIQADGLRKAMGKKIESDMAKLQPKFFDGCKANGISEEISKKIWTDWESFARYAFNKSHSTCYAYVAYRMAYLKAHYPGEFMSAVLSRNMHDIKEITNFIEECKRMSIDVLGPDINESELHFVVNKKGQIRFGMAGIKNVGESAVQSIIEERTKNGPFKDIFDFLTRVDLRSVNKRSLESLAKAGGFDSFPGTHRAQYFYKIPGEEILFLEKLLRYANDAQARASSKQHSLFGGEQEIMLPKIELPVCAPWKKMDQLKFEKEIIGFYMSGHPLDEFRLEIENFCTVSVGELKADLRLFKGREIVFAGIITEATHRTGKTGKPFGSFIVEDYFDSIQIMLFSEEFLKMKHFLEVDSFVYIKAKVESRYDAPDQLNLRINSVTLLQEVFEKFAKSITVALSLHDVTKEKIAFLHSLAKKHKGKNLLRIQVKDEEEKLSVELPSKKFRVEAKEFSRGLAEAPEFSFKIN